MALTIDDVEIERLAAELAALTGESATAAVRTALRERRARLALRGAHGSRSQAMRRYLETEVLPLVPSDRLGRVPSQAEQDALLGYDQHCG